MTLEMPGEQPVEGTTARITSHEKLIPLLHDGEELITNADKVRADEGDPIYWINTQLLGTDLARKLNDSKIWETARVVSVAYNSEGKLLPTQVSVVGVRRNI